MPTLLITGAGRGIGLEFARQYAADGWQVIATARGPSRATALQQMAAAQPTLRLEALEVTDPTSIQALAQRLKGQPLDLLINNAGIYSGTGAKQDASQTLGTLDGDAWLRVLQTNSVAPLLVTQALLDNLRLGATRTIVMISSMMGSIARTPGGTYAYRTSKAALNMAMRCLAMDLRNENFTVASFHPGWVKTDMGGSGADITPQQSVTGLRQQIASLTPRDSGSFLGYDGAKWAW
jgi:NAD(P)-dependent dehydrogenase (short-subunit alcohol dehydrogenase family)